VLGNCGCTRVVQLLLENGADFNSQDEDGRSVLHCAISGNKEEIVRMILEKGPDVNREDILGDTPLHDATSEGYETSIRLLLEVDTIDVNCKNVVEKPPLATAEEIIQQITAELELPHNSNDQDQLRDELGTFQRIAQLLRERGGV
jgi:ankyrin repeat protein